MKRVAIFLAIMLVSVSALFAAGEISTAQRGTIKTSAAEIRALLADVNHWADWCPAVGQAELIQGDGQTVGSRIKFHPVIAGKKLPTAVKLTLSKSEPPGLLEYTGSQPGLKITRGWKLEEKEGVCEITSYETITGPGVKAFIRLYGKDGLDQEHRTWVEAIKKKIESKK